jgi:hypothetical protein
LKKFTHFKQTFWHFFHSSNEEYGDESFGTAAYRCGIEVGRRIANNEVEEENRRLDTMLKIGTRLISGTRKIHRETQLLTEIEELKKKVSELRLKVERVRHN